ncbi:MAG TPA: amino-acid N-acetyltransferase [Halothiobacillaceae bacterium]|nr:amino-acid N-acetyltransferase [Halothiobacillaceae bacterium]
MAQSPSTKTPRSSQELVRGLRNAVPYIREHDGQVFVVAFGGEALTDAQCFQRLIRDLVLIADLGVRLVLVPGARPQINQRLHAQNQPCAFHQNLRITPESAMPLIAEAVGAVQLEIISWLSARLSLASGTGLAQRALTGNFITARPVGVIDGVDLGYTGAVRRVDTAALHAALQHEAVVVQSTLGFSPTGEMFNLRAEEVAEAIAASVGADKLIYLTTLPEHLPSTLTLDEVDRWLPDPEQAAEFSGHLASARRAVEQGVARVHLIDRCMDGGLLIELYTRDGCGTMVTKEPYEQIRPASLDDIGGILALIEPLEREGVLVRRSREQLELEIERFIVIDRDGDVIGCAALYPFPAEKTAELAALVVHPAYQHGGRAGRLLQYLEDMARQAGLESVFLLSTQSIGFFKERGFTPLEISELPPQRQQLYNYKRNSLAFGKPL